HCVANLSYVYNHHERELAERLTSIQHEHHDLTVSTLHAHLDHEHCIESTILKGPTEQVRSFAQALMAERGVRHGQLNLVTVELDESDKHSHPHSHSHGHGYRHLHLKPSR
ncbi:MAG TPA: nickel-responsive transcriptional regulator NikR, partial [Azospira sp.]|nr:nickel-responsive transcriptional regulator NikR [Azospira sp.]